MPVDVPESHWMLWLWLVLINLLMSWRGFRSDAFFRSGLFSVKAVRQKGQWFRLLTSGFLHVSGAHLAFNMLTLYFFADHLETRLGSLSFLVVYLAGLLGGNLLSLLLQRHNPDYQAVGASGAVIGVVFAAIALFPEMKLGFLFLPIPFPAWMFGLGFVLYSIYGIRSQRDNIGHEAHLGGAVIGLLTALLMQPEVLQYNTPTILTILLPALLFLALLIWRPHWVGIHRE